MATNNKDFEIDGTFVVGEHNNTKHDEPRLTISDTGLLSVNSSALSVFGTDKDSHVAIGGNAENISDTLFVDGNSKFTGDMFIGEDSNNMFTVNSKSRFENKLEVGSDFTIDGDLVVKGNFDVQGTRTFINTQHLLIEDPFFILGKENSSDDLDLGFYGRYVDVDENNNNVTRYAGLFRDSDSTDGKFRLFKDTTENLQDSVVNDVNIEHNGYTAAGLVVGSLEATGVTNINNTTSSTSTTTGALIVDGGVGIAENTNIGGTLGVTGATTLSNTLDVSGTTTLSDTLDVTGATNLKSDVVIGEDSTDYLTVNSETRLNNTLGVTGATTLSDTLDVTNDVNINTDKFNITATNGNTSIGGTLSVTSTTTLSDTLDVSGATTLSDTLDVSGATTLSNTLDVTGDTNLKSDVVIGEDSTDYLTVNSETRFLNDVNIGGSSIKLRSSDDTGENNFIEIQGERLHSTHVKKIRDLQDNKISSDLTIGEDSTDLMVVNSETRFFNDVNIDGKLLSNNMLETYDGNTIIYKVTVQNATAAHPYLGGTGSSGYLIDGVESPFIEFVPEKTYKFDQSHSSNYGHPLRFYYEANKTTPYTTNVTTNGTPGSSGAYTQIVVDVDTPRTLFYMCSNHPNMGNQVQVKGGDIVKTGTIISGTWNGTNIAAANGGTGQTIYTDGQLLIGNSTGNTLAKGTLTAGTGISITNGNGSITVANTVTNTDTTYTTSFVDDTDDAILRLTAGGSGSGNDDLKFVAGSNITLTPSDGNLTIASTASGSAITVKNEGSSLSTAATTLNFVGSGVTATGNGAEKTITISGGGGSAITVKDEGSSLSTAATTLNFVGSGVTATGDGATKTITIPGSSGGGGSGATSNGGELLDMKEITSNNQDDIILSAGVNYTDFEYFELAIVNVKGTQNGYIVWQLCNDSNGVISTNTKSKFEIVSLTDNTPNNITNISEDYHILGYNTQAEQNIKAEIYNINKSNKNNFSSFRNVGDHSTSNNTIAQTGNTSSTTTDNYTQYKKIIINNYSESGTKGNIQGTFILYGIKKDTILTSATNNFYLGDGSGMKVIEKQKFDSNTKKNEWTFNISNQNDYDYFKLVGINVKCDTAGQLYWKGIKPDNNDNEVHSEFSYLFSNIGSGDTGRGFGENPGADDGGHLIADNINTSGPINFEVIIYGLNKVEPKYSTFNTSCRNSTDYDQNSSYFLTGSTFQYGTSNSADVICNGIKIYNNDTETNSKFEGTIVLYGYKSNDSMVSKVTMESLVTDTIDINNTLNVKGDAVIGEDSTDLMVVNSNAKFSNDVDVGTDLVVSKTISAKNVNEDIRNKAYTLNNKIDTHGDSWSQLGQDLIGDSGDWSGYSVSLSADGTIVAIGASRHDVGADDTTNEGRTRIYQYSSNTWIQLGQDLLGDTGDESGRSVSLSADGTIVAIGANSHDASGGSNHGRTQIYQYSSNGWSQLGQDLIGDTADYSGYSVSLSADGTIVAIGAYIHDGGKGRTRIYQYSSNTWTKLGQDLIGDAGDQSGISVSLSADGTIVAIGGYLHDVDHANDAGTNEGRTRIYKYSSNTWTKLGQDLLGDPGDVSGRSVSLSADGTIIAIGAYSHDASGGTNHGRTRIYQYSSNNWSQLGQDLLGDDGDYIGYSVSLSADGTIVAIGARYHDVDNANDTNEGRTRIYEYSSNTWSKLGQDLLGDTGDYSGWSVSLSADGTIVAIGASRHDVGADDTTNEGRTRIYHLSEYFKSNVRIDNNLNVVGDVDIQGKIKGDVVIGEDSTDLLVVNSETRFLNDVNIGGSSIKLRSTDDTNDNNFIEIMGKKLHSTHAQTLREIRTITEDVDNENKILKIGSEGAIVGGYPNIKSARFTWGYSTWLHTSSSGGTTTLKFRINDFSSGDIQLASNYTNITMQPGKYLINFNYPYRRPNGYSVRAVLSFKKNGNDEDKILRADRFNNDADQNLGNVLNAPYENLQVAGIVVVSSATHIYTLTIQTWTNGGVTHLQTNTVDTWNAGYIIKLE